jgi:thiamine pyrophosphokinase
MVKMKEYKQAIIVGAAPMGQEEAKLTGILKWAGCMPAPFPVVKEPKELSVTAHLADSKGSCSGNCQACESSCGSSQPTRDVYLVAADGGLDYFYRHHITPDYWVGDMDSLPEELGQDTWNTYLQQVNHCVVPVEKDDTDMALAVAKAYDMGYRDMLMFGGSGGLRISHSLANLQLMHQYEQKGCHIRMMGDHFQAEILANGKKTYTSAMKGNVSVICLSDRATGVSIQGFKYEYQGDLTNQVTLGISNSFVGKDAWIEVEEGVLLLIYESK